MSDFIEEFPDLVASDVCRRIIDLFESDPRKAPTTTTTGPTANRTGTQLNPKPQAFPEWKALIEAVEPAILLAMQRYADKYENLLGLARGERIVCTAPLIERVDPGEGFGWHYDHASNSRSRVMAGLLYLNTVSPGGETLFRQQQRRIQPVAGKIAMFPPYWTHVHRGVTPEAGPKYVLSYFWIYPD
jgi:hypothetical protein